MRSFHDLTVWKKSHALTLAVYRSTQRVKRGEFPGLLSQIRRAATSIPANIAEGGGHFGQREFARFLQMARASASELEYHLLLAAELGMLPRNVYLELESQVKEVKRMLAALIQRVRADAAANPKNTPALTAER